MSMVPGMAGLLVDAPMGRHVAHVHRSSEDLVETAGLFIETGLRRGNGVLVIASTTHNELLRTRLNQRDQRDLYPESFRSSGHLVVLDAYTVLRRFMDGDTLSWVDFRKTIGNALDEGARAFGRRVTRIYDEMGNIPWREGRAKSAIGIEECWNELSRLYPFSLSCGYTLNGLNKESNGSMFRGIEQAHSDVIATENGPQFRAVLKEAYRLSTESRDPTWWRSPVP